jgi:diguanylate cyclase (GGDEF)-like protein
MADETPADPRAAPTRDAELSEANRRLRDSARRRDEILACLSGELREPVAGLRGELRRLLGASPSEAQRAALEAIDRHVARLAGIQRDLAELHDLGSGRAELRRGKADLTDVCARALDAVEAAARERGVGLERELPSFPVTVIADAERVRRALEVLLAHAVSATPPGAALALRLDALPGGGRVAVEARVAPGVATPPALPLAGAVALALCREVVEMHGGVLDVGPGRAEVWLVEDAAAPATTGAPAGPDGRPRLLIVEDDEPTREAISEALADTYDVEPAADGVEGVEAARARRPDLVLMDLFLPRLDGFGALEMLRADPATADVPVILVSGRGDDRTRVRSLDLGAVDFLQKPYSERELRARIERTLRLARRQSQLQALADTDALTGLANRRAFLSRLEQEVKRARRYGTPLACIMVDLDHLKPVNDRFGHPAGDRAISSLAAVLRGELRETDFGARYGGDEFVMLLPHTTAGEGRALAERICERLPEAGFEAGGQRIDIQASFGVAELPPGSPGEAAEGLVRNADAALYAAKRSGRARVAVHGAPPAAP